MSRAPGCPRSLPFWLTLISLVAGCQTPTPGGPAPPDSSMLAVDVRFPFPQSRDPALVQAFFVRGPVHAGLEELPVLIPSSFVKNSRAYLVDPVPGTYSLVAVSNAVAPPL